MICRSFSSSERKYPCVSSRSAMGSGRSVRDHARRGRLPLPKLRLAAHELVPAAAYRRRLALGNLIVQQVPHAAIELGTVGAKEHHVEVVALLPVAFRAELAFHDVEEFRPGQRVRDADADV